MRKSIIIALLGLFIPFVMLAWGNANDDVQDKTLSPYFFVESDNPSVDAMPLLSTTADVNILGVIADVTVRQVYKNNGSKPLEAIYVFPASTRAAVYAMTMKIGDRVLKAEVQTRKQARETYEQAKQEGRSASLLEQERPNVFQMSVANIMPGDIIEVELKYTELLIPENAIYEFVYPTVVGPRYSNKSAESAADDDEFVETPYTHEDDAPAYDFDINVNINAGMSLSEISSPSHKINIEYPNEKKMTARISLSTGQEKSGNKDYVLQYSLSGNRIRTGLLLSEGDKENFFLLMLQPPKKVKKEEIPPREYIFVIDVSGSMNGYPLDIAKEMIKKLLGSLRENDLFNIILFAGSSRFLNCMSQPATEENIAEALRVISKERGGGGTELISALRKVYNNPKASGYSRSIVILTDGYIDVEEETFNLIANNLNKSNVFSFGIGEGVNRYLIEGMARVGDGQPFFVLDSKNSEPITEKFIKYIESPVLTDVNIDFIGFNTYDVEPHHIADVMEQRPIIVYGKWRGSLQGTIVVSGKIASGEKLNVNIPISVFAGEERNDAIKYIWARNKIAILADYNALRNDSARITEVTELGLKYNLLTKYTSFVAVDYKIRNNGKEIVKVKQPLPLPEGVSDYAVGTNSGLYSSGSGSSSMALRPGRGSLKTISAIKMYAPLNPNANMSDEFIEEKEETIDTDVETIDFENVVKYPQKAVANGVQGNVIVWALYRKINNELSKCVYVKPVNSPNSILYAASKDALLKTTIANSGNNSPYVWKKLEIEYNAEMEKAKIVSILKVTNVYSKPDINIIKSGSSKSIVQGDRITIRYSIFTDECEKVEFNKEQTIVVGKDKINPVIERLINKISEGGIIRANVPKTLFFPETENNRYNYKNYHITLELIDIK